MVGAVVGAVVVVLSGGGAGGCGATQAVTTARPAPTMAAAGLYQRGECAEPDVSFPGQPSLKTASSRMELFPASPAWPSNGVTPSICSMPMRVE